MGYEYLIFAGILIVIALIFFLFISMSAGKSMHKIDELWESNHWLQDEMDSLQEEFDETYNEIINLKMKMAVLQSRMDFEPIQEISYKRGPGRPAKE